MSVSFDNIPGSGLIAPLFAFEVTSGGLYESTARLVLFGHALAAGSLAEGEMSVCTSLEEASALAGAGSMLREMYRIARQNAPVQEIWLAPVAETGVKGTWTLTVGTPPTNGGTGVVDIAGEAVSVAIGAGDTAATVASSLASAISAYYNPLTGAQLPVMAAAATNVVTLTARHAGAIYADLDVTLSTTASDNAFDGVVTIAAGVAPTGSPTIAAALSALGDDPADFIVSPFGDTANLDRAATALGDASGRWSYARQSYGHYWTAAKGTTGELTTIGLARNDRHATIIPRYAGSPEPAWLWVAAVAARLAPWLSDESTGNVSRNQTGRVVEGLSPPRSRANWPGYTTRNALLASGISAWKITGTGAVAVDKIISTARLNASGDPDATFRDIQSLYQVRAALRIMRSDLSTDHGQKSLADSNPAGLDAISTPATIRGTLIHAYEKCVRRGILEDADGFAARLVVERDEASPNRVNVLAPLDRVNALDVLAANAKIYAQYDN